MKKNLFAILSCALVLAACQEKEKPGDDGNGGGSDASRVAIQATLTDLEWSEGDAIGIISTCSRGDKSAVSMSSNKPAKYLAAKAGASVNFKPASDADAILSEQGDRSFKFYAAYPCPEGVDNFKTLPVSADSVQTYSASPLANLDMIASTSALNVLAPINLTMETPFALLKIMMPKDVMPGEKSTLKSITLSGKDVTLSMYGEYNIEKREFTKTDSTSHVTVNFPSGLVLEEKNTPIYIVVNPFTVPDGGLKLTVETMTGTTFLDIWDGDAGKKIEEGSVNEWTNVINPVTFPVIFPLGRKTYSEEEGEILVFSQVPAGSGIYKYQPKWSTQQRWIAYDGATPLDAYAQWHDVKALPDAPFKTVYENVNSGGKISSPGMKGIWTGDYMEFVLPVVNFKAGTTLNVSFPFYGRQHPMFWDLEYFDGGVWKCNRSIQKSDLPAKDETGTHADMAGKPIECEATFVTNRGNNTHSLDVTFENDIPEGYVKLRLTVVHGEYQNGGSSDTEFDYIRSTPWIEGGARYGAPCYFYCKDDPATDIDESMMDFVISVKK